MTPQRILGYQLHWIHQDSKCEDLAYQPHVLYESWETMLEAAAAIAASEAEKGGEYIQVLNKIDDLSFSDCHHFKNTTLYILVDERKPYEKYGAVWVCPVFQAIPVPPTPKIESV
jgi:hypothetical protein